MYIYITRVNFEYVDISIKNYVFKFLNCICKIFCSTKTKFNRRYIFKSSKKFFNKNLIICEHGVGNQLQNRDQYYHVTLHATFYNFSVCCARFDTLQFASKYNLLLVQVYIFMYIIKVE